MKSNYSLRQLSLSLLLFSSVVAATPALNNNVAVTSTNSASTLLTLSGSAEGYLNNNQVQVTLYQESRNADLNTLVNQLNETLNNALTLGNKYPAVHLSTGRVSYLPLYSKSSNDASATPSAATAPIWQGSVSLKIQSDNFKQVAQLLAELQQQQLLIENVNYSATSSEKQQLEQQLIPEAIQNLTQKADSVAKAMGKKLTQIQKISLSQYNDATTPFLLSTYTDEQASRKSSTQLPMEPGKSKIAVTVNATVALE